MSRALSMAARTRARARGTARTCTRARSATTSTSSRTREPPKRERHQRRNRHRAIPLRGPQRRARRDAFAATAARTCRGGSPVAPDVDDHEVALDPGQRGVGEIGPEQRHAARRRSTVAAWPRTGRASASSSTTSARPLDLGVAVDHGDVGRAVHREAGIAAEVVGLAGVGHHRQPELALAEVHLEPGEPGRAVGPHGAEDRCGASRSAGRAPRRRARGPGGGSRPRRPRRAVSHAARGHNGEPWRCANRSVTSTRSSGSAATRSRVEITAAYRARAKELHPTPAPTTPPRRSASPAHRRGLPRALGSRGTGPLRRARSGQRRRHDPCRPRSAHGHRAAPTPGRPAEAVPSEPPRARGATLGRCGARRARSRGGRLRVLAPAPRRRPAGERRGRGRHRDPGRATSGCSSSRPGADGWCGRRSR